MGKDVAVLKELGLTSTQARVYLALCKFGMLDTKQTAKFALMSRPDVYRVLQSLEKLGLVEKAISRPVKFSAIEIDDCISFLLRRKKEKTAKLESEIQFLLKDFKKNSKTQLYDIEFHTVLVPGKKALLVKLKKAIGEAQDSLCCLVSFRKGSKALFSLSDELKLAMDRGVKLQIVTEKGEDETLVPNILRKYLVDKEQPLNTRSATSELKTHILVVDKNQVLISTSTKTGFAESPAVWSNNPCVVALAQDYFETQWKTICCREQQKKGHCTLLL